MNVSPTQSKFINQSANMIEFFTSAYYVTNMNNKKEKENKKIKELFSNDENVTNYLTKKSVNVNVLNLACGLITLVISILSAKLALDCNSKKSDTSQVVAVLFGFFFSGFYLLYYFIWHKILGNKC